MIQIVPRKVKIEKILTVEKGFRVTNKQCRQLNIFIRKKKINSKD